MRDRWIILLLVGAGAFMFRAAETCTVFDDEAFSCRRYAMPLGEMVSALWNGAEPDPPLYYVLQNLWVRAFGIGPWGLRGLSILLFLTGLVFMRSAGTAWFDERTGRMTMLLCALHPAHLFFGMAGRWYAAMFCIVALMIWSAGRVRHAAGPQVARRWMMIWSVVAAAACYTNYFGPVVAGLTWLAVLSGVRFPRAWIGAGVFAALLYLPWLKPFVYQVGSFPSVGGGVMPYAACAGRTVVALAAGNLASVGAWWVWAPMIVVACMLAFLIWRDRTRLRPILIITLGCFAAGISSRIMIDKYVMTFSGAACLLVAAAIVGPAHSPRERTSPGTKAQGKLALGFGGGMLALGFGGSKLAPGENRGIRRIAAAALALAWIGCGVNLVTQRHWSSFRWLDPFEEVIAEWRADQQSPPADCWVLDHTSARYYYALEECHAAESSRRVAPAAWLRIAGIDGEADESIPRPATSASILARFASRAPAVILTLRASAFSDDPSWEELQRCLDRAYVIAGERSYLPDPDAALKDRLDPKHVHPAHRITVRLWRRAAP